MYQTEKETNYIYDLSRGLPVLLVETDGQGNYNNYIHGGRILSRDGWEGQIYYHQDGLGSTKKITDSQGNILNSYEYDAFGNVVSVTESVYNPVLYAGELYDENGLLFLKARYYDPQTGRFLTKDTYLGDLSDPLTRNLYTYVSNNPVLYIDPSGHIKICSGSDLLDFGLDLAPGVSNFKSGVEFVTGYNYITGDKLSDFERVLALSGIFAGGWVKKIKYLKHADDIAGGFAKGAKSAEVKILGKGSTGRTTANNLTEQLAMKEVKSNPLEGAKQLTSVKMSDSRWPANDGWVKMSKNVNGVETHYVYNTKTGVFDDFKFK